MKLGSSFFCIFACLGSVVAGEVSITTADGKTIAGELVSLDGQNLKYKSAGGTTAVLSIDKLAAIQIQKSPAPPREAKYDSLELNDGSIVLASAVSFRGKQMTPILLTHPSNIAPPSVDLPTSLLTRWMRNANDTKLREEWKKLEGERVKKDRVVLRQADGYNVLAGTILDANDAGDAFAFDQDGGGRLSLRVNRITGGLLVYRPNTEIVPPTLCKVVDLFGNTWLAAKIELIGKGIKLTTVCGASISYPELDALVLLDFAKGNLLYLSDLTPIVTYPEPDDAKSMGAEFALARKVIMDRAGGGLDLIVFGKRYAKGIAIPKDTSATFKIDGSYRELKFVLAAPPRGEGAGFLLPMTLFIDDGPVMIVSAGDVHTPNELAFNVKEAKEIRIVVGSRGFDGDRQLLVDARLQK